MINPCPGDPNGHHWILHSEDVWLERHPRPSFSWTAAAWSALGLLIPVVGWTCVVMYWCERPVWRVGVQRRWFCQLCRQEDVIKHRDNEEEA